MMASMSISMRKRLAHALGFGARDRLVVGGADNEASGASLGGNLEPIARGRLGRRASA